MNGCHFETYSMNNRAKRWFQSGNGHYYIYKCDNIGSGWNLGEEKKNTEYKIPVCNCT